jgi:hypothetical protein
MIQRKSSFKIRDQGNYPGSFYSQCYLTLVLDAIASRPPGSDFALVGYKFLKQTHVLVIYIVNIFLAKITIPFSLPQIKHLRFSLILLIAFSSQLIDLLLSLFKENRSLFKKYPIKMVYPHR